MYLKIRTGVNSDYSRLTPIDQLEQETQGLVGPLQTLVLGLRPYEKVVQVPVKNNSRREKVDCQRLQPLCAEGERLVMVDSARDDNPEIPPEPGSNRDMGVDIRQVERRCPIPGLNGHSYAERGLHLKDGTTRCLFSSLRLIMGLGFPFFLENQEQMAVAAE